MYLNVENMINIAHRKLKLSMHILDIVMEGTMSHILYLGPTFNLMCLRKCFSKFHKMLPDFLHKTKTKA